MTTSAQFPRCYARFDTENIYNETREVDTGKTNAWNEKIKETVHTQIRRNKTFFGECEEVFRKMEEHRPDSGDYSKIDERRMRSGEIFIQFTPAKIEAYSIRDYDHKHRISVYIDFTELWLRVHDYMRKDRLERIISGLSGLDIHRHSDIRADSEKSPWKVFGGI